METKANFALIGAFAIAGFLGMIGFLMWFAKLELNRQFAYYDVYFSEVSGLGVASEVRFAGLTVGTVVDMELAPDQLDRPVRVRLEVAEDTPIRTDSRASLELQGVTGVSNVFISAGRRTSPLLRDEFPDEVPVIQSSRSAFQTLSDEGPQIIERLSRVAEQLTELLGEQNQARVNTILDNIERSSGNLDQAMADISAATDAIGLAAEGIADFGTRLEGLGETADTAMKDFSTAAQRADTALDSATQTLDELRDYVAGDLRGMTRQLTETASGLQTELAQLGDRAGGSLDQLDRALDAGTRAFDQAEVMFSTDLGPIIADLRNTLAQVNQTLASVSDDLPRITARLHDGADAAANAFASLQRVVDNSAAGVQQFTREALPQFSRLSLEIRDMVGNIDQLVTTLRRNPSQILSGPRTPEFRR